MLARSPFGEPRRDASGDTPLLFRLFGPPDLCTRPKALRWARSCTLQRGVRQAHWTAPGGPKNNFPIPPVAAITLPRDRAPPCGENRCPWSHHAGREEYLSGLIPRSVLSVTPIPGRSNRRNEVSSPEGPESPTRGTATRCFVAPWPEKVPPANATSFRMLGILSGPRRRSAASGPGVHPVSKYGRGTILGLGWRNRLIWVASQSNK